MHEQKQLEASSNHQPIEFCEQDWFLVGFAAPVIIAWIVNRRKKKKDE